jgi:2'-5' RNA ligase
MGSVTEGPARTNLYALVIYIPDPLGRFLDDLRRELVPGCIPRAHVTVLPPRPLAVDPQAASAQVRQGSRGFAPFDLELGRVSIFEKTDVIYLELLRGTNELKEMYGALNGGLLAYKEPFPYHPHVTLAQGLPPDRVEALHQTAVTRWAEFAHTRAFRAERVTFVQSMDCISWVDLAECSLDGVPSAR